MTALTEDLFERFKELVYRQSDLHFSPHKDMFFERQLRHRLKLMGIEDFESYYGRLVEDPLELSSLVQGLTTNQTYFFRNPAQFRALKEVVLPDIIEARNKEVIASWGARKTYTPGARHPAMKIRIWSSGCSTGEEAYSIAFTLLDVLKYPRAWDVEILGTDISEATLDKAKSGVYPKEALTGLDDRLIEKYMEPVEGGWAVKVSVAAIVKFFEANLKTLSGPVPGRLDLRSEGTGMTLDVSDYFDVVFCRNVMIYFDREGQQRLVSALYGCLRPGGYLFTGDSEPLHLFRHGFEAVGGGDALYYRKPL